ncbi:MurR/RpiR family transcriptional regulator [Weissella paramesenteroides]|jgi:DNA-binding MurR/RpiR family transcriptional regulator|uniref:MurR/RpiR family transcriptional regulator n=1 Tax=Weissella paramesenteroides TaxID=1249 RepID=UPI00123C17F7|nr:MurR/RpiR family transcriptional regulator [Weissella paramesenteroides]KAA8439589.1 MurR/RpiR family transcriptional regulator [Weissella paramesenteroides]KAA8441741.1 MurR/RpiR family transcriptional regulator [Weissella paramesenteroides]KAA8444754.1 MurR/RpiR family transcriptional regulator [Weissella paramesenteroides]KAA8445310.1 MurR/RpiR family transcriptional regulator [Weissella paramesenteroides]KAA8446177.1 MurR/RpiR family transcriptional regulator [Weissella paramesenteroide
MNSLFVRLSSEKNFTTSERKIANFFLEKPQLVIDATAEKIGKLTQTSSSAIVRFAKKMGYTGFPAMKLDVAVAIKNTQNTHDLTEVEADESFANILEKTSARFKIIPDVIATQNATEDFSQATSLIENARHIFVYGVTASSLVAQDIQQKFTRIGLDVIYHADFHQMITTMQATATKQDLSIVISESGRTFEALNFKKISNDLGLKVIVLTNETDSEMTQDCDIVLTTTSQQFDKVRFASTTGLLSQLYVVDILFYAYISKHYEDSQKKVEATRLRINKLYDQRR